MIISQKFIEKHLHKRSIISYLLLPLSLIFLEITNIRRFLYNKNILKRYSSKVRIISIGNLTAGGSGKTPFIIFLANYLKSKGKRVAISHRGYRGKYEHTVRLISDENEIFPLAIKAGDEVVSIAKNCPGIPVIIGKNRKKAIEILENNFSLDYIILDDSFQHLAVKHYYDFLLFNSKNPIGNGFLMPAGILRDSISKIKYADCLIFTNAEKDYHIHKKFRKFNKLIFCCQYQAQAFIDTYTKREVPLSEIKNKRVMLLSGIGTPQSFEYTVKQLGIDFIEHKKYPDHYELDTRTDLLPLEREAILKKVDVIIITEKDYYRHYNSPTLAIKTVYLKIKVIFHKFQLLEEELRDRFPKRIPSGKGSVSENI